MTNRQANRQANRPIELTEATLDREAGYQLLDLLQDRATQEAALPGLEEIAPASPTGSSPASSAAPTSATAWSTATAS